MATSLVTPGNQIPGIPRHQVKGGIDYFVTPALKLGTDVIWVSSQWYVGDDANQNVKLADYWVANLHGSYQFTKEVQIYGVINNLFNRKFATFGTYFDPQSIVNVLPESADRPPHHHAGAAALYLCRDARKVVIEPYLPTAGETSTPRVPWRREASALREGPVTNSGWWDAASAFANRGHTVAYVRGKYAVGRQPYHRGSRVPTKYPESKAHWNWVWKPNPLLGRLVGSLYSVLR